MSEVKKIDGRSRNKGNQGWSTKPNSGRRPLSKIERIQNLCLSAVKDVWGSEEEFIKEFAQYVKGNLKSHRHLEIFLAYFYGKPQYTIEVNENETVTIEMVDVRKLIAEDAFIIEEE